MSLLLEQDHIIMHGISWQTFQQLLADRGERCGVLADAIVPDRPLDLTIDPPPDLVIEVDITRSSLNKLPLYAALAVPEVWRYTNGEVEIRCLTADAYTVVHTSRVLPGIHARMATHCIEGARTATNQTVWFKSVVAAVAAQT